MHVFYCIRKISSYSPTIGDKWKAFMNCIEKIKGLPPIGDSDSCEGCPKFKHRGPVVTYPGYREETQKEKDFIVPTNITFDNEGSEIHTIIEIETRDRLGLLYDLAKTLSDNYISISSAIIATFGEQAVDTFYVKDLFGLKLHSLSKREKLEHKLKEAIQAGTLIDPY